MKHKVCSKCGEKHAIEDFGLIRGAPRAECKFCILRRTRESRAKPSAKKFSVAEFLTDWVARHARKPLTSYDSREAVSKRTREFTGPVWRSIEDDGEEMIFASSTHVKVRTIPLLGHPTGVMYGR